MNSTTVPIIRYQDAKKAIDWLCEAFGFEVFLEVPGSEGKIEHARLILEKNMVMIASLGRDGDYEKRFKAPTDINGVTQGVSIFLENPDEVYAKAIGAGAEIIDELADFHLGGRMFSCADIESHLWVFGSHDPWEKIW